MGQGRRLITRAKRYDPELYRLLHRGHSGDAAYYARRCKGARHVLELGCGYGRLITSLLPKRGGYVGLDIEPGLLRLARSERAQLPGDAAKRVLLRRGDMRDFSFAARFDRIVIAYSGLFCLSTRRQVQACLKRVREHLAPDGELLLDTYAADAFHASQERSDPRDARWEWLAEVEHAGLRYNVFERTQWRRGAQRLLVRYRYTPVAGGRSREGSIEHRYILDAELKELLASAGLRMLDRHGDFHGGAYRKHSELRVVRAGAA